MTFERNGYRILSVLGTFKAARRGVGPFVRRRVRQKTLGAVSRSLRKVIKP